MKLFIAAAISIALAACATTGGTSTSKTPEQLIFQLKSDYNIALTVAVAYKNLPPCEAAGAPVLCSKVSVVRQLQYADNLAHPAIVAAENTVRNPCPAPSATPCDPASKMQLALAGANQAIAALTAITATLATK